MRWTNCRCEGHVGARGTACPTPANRCGTKV
nr:MAG TPA: hypothetical protein [Caudoviricetes sp.]DAZ70664.1 MAG TPA: hypothetical protein [Caudoviricetes sp.]